jgi:peptidase inhibitor family I36
MRMDMTLRRRMTVCLVAGLAVMLSLAWVVGDARAASLDAEVRAALRDGPPGGKRIGPSRVAWTRRGVTMTVAARGKMEPVNYRECPRLYVCLWQDRDATGRRIQFKEYGTYRLRAWGMSGARGASSYYNHQCCLAGAELGFGFRPPTRFSLWTWGNIPRHLNDRATYVRLYP